MLLAILPGLLALGLGATAQAQQAPSDGKGDTILLRQIGAGASVGDYGSATRQGAASIQANAGQLGNGKPALSGDDGQVYAFGNAGIDYGPAGLGFDVNTHVGKNFISRDANQSAIPVFGVEPLNFAFGSSVNIGAQRASALGREPGRTPYFQYTPMGVVGVHLFGDTCQAMALARGGIALGTAVTENGAPMGIGAAYGIGLEAMCRDTFLMDAELTRVTNGSAVSDEASLMAAVRLPGTRWSLGVDLDGRSSKTFDQSNPVYAPPVSSGTSTELSAKAVAGVIF